MSEVFESIMRGMNEAVDFMEGKESGAVVTEIEPFDVKAIREQLGMTQEKFSLALGVGLGTIRHWERGDRRPRGPARVLLNLLRKEPEYILKILRAA